MDEKAVYKLRPPRAGINRQGIRRIAQTPWRTSPALNNGGLCAYPDVDHPVIIGQVVDSVDDLPPAGSARDVAVEQLPTLAPPAPARVLEVTDQLFLLGWSGPKGTVAKSGVGAWPTPTA